VGLTVRNIVGPELTHKDQYNIPSAAEWSIVDTPTPPQGSRWLKYESAATGTEARIFSGAGALDSGTAPFTWLVCRAFRVSPLPTSGARWAGIFRWDTSPTITGACQLRAQGQPGDLWRLVLVRQSDGAVLARGPDDLPYDTDVSLRVEWDWRTIRVWANGVLAISYDHSGQAGGFPVSSDIRVWPFRSTADSRVVTTLWRGLALFTGTSRADRPAADVEVGLHLPVGNGDLNDYGDQDAPTTPGAASYVNWDDYNAGGGGKAYPYTYPRAYLPIGTPGSGAVNEADYNVAPNGPVTDKAESHQLSNATYTKTIRGVKAMFWSRSSAGTKNVQRHALLRYNGVNALAQLTGTTDVFGDEHAYFSSPPGGGAWSQSLMDDLQGGHFTSPLGSAAERRIAAFAIEGVAVSDDPPVKRLVQVI
jgi:hypothetical protein